MYWTQSHDFLFGKYCEVRFENGNICFIDDDEDGLMTFAEDKMEKDLDGEKEDMEEKEQKGWKRRRREINETSMEKD